MLRKTDFMTPSRDHLVNSTVSLDDIFEIVYFQIIHMAYYDSMKIFTRIHFKRH